MFLSQDTDLGEAFKRYFEIVPAYSDALKDEVFRIRHQVFCEELGFEPQKPDRRERDEYDAHALHLLIRSVKTGNFMGCTRIIRARPGDLLYPLPFEMTCAATIDRSIVDPATLPRESIAEVSRLAVAAEFRTRKGEPNNPPTISENDFGTPAQPRFPYIPVGLYFASAELAILNGIETLFVLTEERLARHFRTLGIKIETIGGPVEHRGERIPSRIPTPGFIDNIHEDLRPLYRVTAEQVARVR